MANDQKSVEHRCRSYCKNNEKAIFHIKSTPRFAQKPLYNIAEIWFSNKKGCQITPIQLSEPMGHEINNENWPGNAFISLRSPTCFAKTGRKRCPRLLQPLWNQWKTTKWALLGIFSRMKYFSGYPKKVYHFRHESFLLTSCDLRCFRLFTSGFSDTSPSAHPQRLGTVNIHYAGGGDLFLAQKK